MKQKPFTRPPLSPEEMANKITNESMERLLVYGFMRSFLFYMEMRDIVCPYDPITGNYRADFTVLKYNVLYRAIDAYWRYAIQAYNTQADCIAHVPSVIAFVIDWANNKAVDGETCQQLCAEVVDDVTILENVTLASSRALAQTDGFKSWLDKRVIEDSVAKLNKANAAGKLTVEGLRESVVKISATGPYQSAIVDSMELLIGQQRWSSAFAISIPDINEKIGGGFRKPEAWLVAGLVNGGKTVLANQLIWEFASQGLNVLAVTTEQKPSAVISRIASNATNTPFSEFITGAMTEEAAMRPNLPPYLWTDDNKKEAMELLKKYFTANVRYADWTGGNVKRTIQAHLEPEIDNLMRNGWQPDVIVFDWLGGALATISNQDEMRFVYKQTADAFVELCHRRNMLGFIFAQLAMGQATNKTIIRIDMLAEAKNMADRMDGFIGLSALQEQNKDVITSSNNRPKLQRIQYINIDKTRTGPGGWCKVRQNFAYQRYERWNRSANDSD